MMEKRFDRKLGMSILVILLGLSLFSLLREDPKYHKTSRFEHLLNAVWYLSEGQLAQAWVYYRDSEEFYLAMPYFLQENGLTCEVAALRTALGYRGVHVTETELIENLAFDTRGPMSPNGIWGDPEEGFIGDINGSIFDRTGFGVHEKPIAELARNYVEAEIIEDANLEKVLSEVASGNPVIAWGLLSRRKPISWQTEEGKLVEVEPGEHARVVIGYTGSVGDPDQIILLDPIYGRIKMSKDKFISDWNIMDNRAVVIYGKYSLIDL